MTETILLVVALLLVAFGGLMAALDAARGVTSKADLQDWSTGVRSGRAMRAIADDIDAHANAVVFIRVLAETTAAVLVTVAFTMLFEDLWGAIAAALLMTGASFVLVGASPRSVGRQRARGVLQIFAPVVRFVRILLGPIAHALVAFGNRVTPGRTRGASFTSEEQLLSMVDEAAEADLIEDDDRELIHSVFDFTDTYVRSVMVPRTDMVTLDSAAMTDEAIGLFLKTGVSRVPAVEGDDDDVVGMLYLKDLVELSYGADEWRTLPVRPSLRPPVFVPESMRAETLLQQMKRDAVHACIVVDEYGGVAGLVTLEDLIEELVGEIADEYDTPQREVTEIEPGRYRVTARLSLHDLGDLFDVEIDEEEVDSVGGLLGKALGRVPQPGAQATVAGIVLTGGGSRGRGRGIATVLVEASEELKAAAETYAPTTGETEVVMDDRRPQDAVREARRRRSDV